MKIQNLLDQAKLVANIPSDNQLAKKLGVTQGAVWKWRKGRDLPKPEYANQLAVLAGLDPADVVADVLIMSAKDEALRKTFARFKSAVAAALPFLITLPQVLAQGINCILC